MNILICTIMRNCEPALEKYWKQINDFIPVLGEGHNWYISIYENDSTDKTPELIQQLDMAPFVDYSVVSEKLDTPFFGSVVDEDRVRNLANARNKALYAKDMVQNVDKVLWIEPDITYDSEMIIALLHPELFGIEEVDIFSGLNCDPKRGNWTYDTWATRRDSREESGERYGDWVQNPIQPFWSTFNAIIVYNAEPIKKGITFGWFNKRLNKFDCDTVVICENFREAGYDKILVHQHLHCFHD